MGSFLPTVKITLMIVHHSGSVIVSRWAVVRLSKTRRKVLPQLGRAKRAPLLPKSRHPVVNINFGLSPPEVRRSAASLLPGHRQLTPTEGLLPLPLDSCR
jgi:hypothetical protein